VLGMLVGRIRDGRVVGMGLVCVFGGVGIAWVFVCGLILHFFEVEFGVWDGYR